MATSSETLDLFFAFGPEVAPPPDHPWARFYAAGEHSELLKEYAQTLENASGEELSTEAGAFSAASALAVFLQANVTGPAPAAFDDETRTTFSKFCNAEEGLEIDGEQPYDRLSFPETLVIARKLLGWAEAPNQDPSSASSIMAHHENGAPLILRARCAFAWQRSLFDASETGTSHAHSLRRVTLASYSEFLLKFLHLIEDSSGKRSRIQSLLEKQCPEKAHSVKRCERKPTAALKKGVTQVFCELCTVLCWYQAVEEPVVVELIEVAGKISDFTYSFDGIEGIRRKFQTKKTAQLVVRTNRDNGCAEESGVEQTSGCQIKAIQLNELNPDNDILEAPKKQTLKEEEAVSSPAQTSGVDSPTTAVNNNSSNSGSGSPKGTEEDNEFAPSPLGPTEQLVLLAHCHVFWCYHTKRDPLMLEQLAALCARILILPESGLSLAYTVYSAALWFRCKHEYYRSHTKERACLQLQTLVEQFVDENPIAQARSFLASHSGYPPRHMLQKEFGHRMMQYGMVMTAFKHFESLEMWPEAVDCLMAADRRTEALKLIDKCLNSTKCAIAVQCRMYCALGDLAADENPNDGLTEKAEFYYEKAWEISKHRFGKAQKLLGWLYFKRAFSARNATQEEIQSNLHKAASSFEKSLALNPCNPSICFSLGCVHMRLENFEKALNAFKKHLDFFVHTAEGTDQNDRRYEVHANMAACLVHMGKFKLAKVAITEACFMCFTGENQFKVWETNLAIHMRLRDVKGCCKAICKLVDLDREVDLRALITLTNHALQYGNGEEEGEEEQVDSAMAAFFDDNTPSAASTNAPVSPTTTVNNEGPTPVSSSSPESSGKKTCLCEQVLQMLEHVVTKQKKGETYRCIAQLQEFLKMFGPALDNRLREFRHLSSFLINNNSESSKAMLTLATDDRKSDDTEKSSGTMTNEEKSAEVVANISEIDPAMTVFGQKLAMLVECLEHCVLCARQANEKSKCNALGVGAKNTIKKLRVKADNFVHTGARFGAALKTAAEDMEKMVQTLLS